MDENVFFTSPNWQKQWVLHSFTWLMHSIDYNSFSHHYPALCRLLTTASSPDEGLRKWTRFRSSNKRDIYAHGTLVPPCSTPVGSAISWHAWYHDWGFSPCQRPLVWTERWQIPRRFSWRAVQPCRGMERWRWNCGWRRRSCGSRPGLPGLEDPQRCDFEAILSHFEPTSCGTSPTAVVYVHCI